MKHHSGAVVAITVDPQGKVLYTCGADGFIKYYDIDHGREDSLLLKPSSSMLGWFNWIFY